MPKQMVIFCCGLAALCASQASAAELIFENGERLKGSIIELSNDSVRFKSANLGEITVPLVAVEIKRDAVPVITIDLKSKGLANASEDPPEPALMEKEEGRGLHDVALNRWTSLWERNAFWSTVERYCPLKTWKNRVDFGFFFQNTTRKDLRYDFGFNTQKRVDKHETEFNFSYACRRIDEDVRRDWTKGNLLYRYDIGDRVFIQSNARYQRRPEESIYSEFSESIGLGYRWLDADSVRGTITPEIGFNYADIGVLDSYSVAIGSFVQDFEIDLSDTLKISQDLLLQYSPSDQGDFAINFQVAVENRITQSLSLRIAYIYIYDERVEFENQKTEETAKITVGAYF